MIYDFFRGLRASFSLPCLKALAWCYGLCLVFTAFVTLLLYQFVLGTVQNSVAAESLRGGLTFDWFIDVSGAMGTSRAFSTIALVAVLMIPLYLSVVVFLSGGIVSSVRRALGLEDEESKISFLTLCAWYVGPMARIAILEIIVVLVLVAALLMGTTTGGVTRRENVLAWVWLLGSGLALTLVTSVFDYARIVVVGLGKRSAFGAIGEGLRMVGRRPLSFFGLAVITGMFGLAVWFGGIRLHSLPRLSTGGGVFLGVLIGQLGILARLWTRIVAYASETSLWVDSQPRVAAQPAIEPQTEPFALEEA